MTDTPGINDNPDSTAPPIKEFKNTLFPTKRLKELPTRKKVSVYARRFDYEIKVNDEKLDMKLTIKGFTGKEIDFRVSHAPVTWGERKVKDSAPAKWFVYESKSNSLAFADNEMEHCICGFLYLLGNVGKKEILSRIRHNKDKES